MHQASSKKFYKTFTMKNFTNTLTLFLVFMSCNLFAQVNFTAKDQVNTYGEPFLFGSNFGYNPPWQDEQLADIAAGNPALGIEGAGVKSSRPSLPGWFMEEYGYDFRLNTYQHYDDLGLKDNVCIVGFPSDEQKDPTQHCPGVQSEMFANLYLPIWDDGTDGTPYNDDNYYAAYLYKTVFLYKDYVKFWEIWNEPGFDYSGAHGWQEPGQPGNWWENNPDPCDNKLRAPIQEYVRTLRISYEIIKTIDPEAYVIVAGVGFESFLDALLRNTDNPVDGSVTPEYPHGGGAYFDVMGFHSYTHFDGTMKYWDNTTQSFVYERHSDKGVSGVLGRQTRYQAVLDNYGFDGSTYPKNEWIITEINGPRKQFQDFVGSEEYQRHFLIKSAIVCMKNDIRAMHVYNLAERKTYNEATYEFDLFGLYEKVLGTQPYNQRKTSEGIAYKTTSDLLSGARYDAARTAQLNLPSTVDGGAFVDADGIFTYVLWAKTTQDMSEVANATYTFPSNLNINYLEERDWNYSRDFQSFQVDPNGIQLTASPAFFTESIFSTDVSAGCEPVNVNFQEQFIGPADSYSWFFEGGSPETSTDASPAVTFVDAGTHAVTLEIQDAAGNVLANQSSFVVVRAAPVTNFEYTLSGPIIVFENTSTASADSYTWSFGDGNSSSEHSPTHVFTTNGTYTVTLISANECGASTHTESITVGSSSNFQIPYNADSVLEPYRGTFRPGTNFGYNPPWTDITLADLAGGNPLVNVKGIGAKTSRPALPGWFVDDYGYEFNLPNYEHYDNLGIEENVMIIGFPSAEERDPAFYCNGVQSEMFANMYSDIWDDGANGTPYNDDNYLAAYLYKVVELYGENIRFWEIWNEPGFDYTGNCGWREPGDETCNWWDNNPDPCDFKLRAPIMHYVRLLRISYEIIKTLQPDDYLVVAGVGFPSYLDAILRNTDNPVDGSVTPDYPNGGGAYFDVMGFHAYPHFDGTMRWWDPAVNGFHYERHSDQAITSITNRQNLYQGVLENYGYDGTTKPNKEWIITESNLPRRQFQDYIGSEDAQINYMAKAVVTCYKNDIHQFHVYNLGEADYITSAGRDFDVMGLYQKLLGTDPYEQVVNLEGIAYKTVSDILFGTEYDEAKTNAMNLPANIDGAAFIDAEGNYQYALWAVTTEDQSEVAAANYTFPSSFNISELFKREWDHSETGTTETISPNNVALTGRPIYLSESPVTIVVPTATFFPDNSTGCAPFTVTFQDASHSNIDNWNWTFDGPNGYQTTSTEESPSITFTEPGTYYATLVVSNAAGENTTTQIIRVDGALTGGFTYVINGNQVIFTSTATGEEGYAWDFGDAPGYINSQNATHTYLTDGLYNVGFSVYNTCDTIVTSQLIEIGMGSGIPPTPNFTTDRSGGCGPVPINYINLSENATSFLWTFPGGVPSTSTEQNPTVVYNTPGSYSATLEAFNTAGTTTFTQNNVVGVQGLPTPSYTYSLNTSPTLSFVNNSTDGVSFFWDFGDGNNSTQQSPTHTFAAGGVYNVVLTAANACGSASFTQIVNIDGNNLPPLASFAVDNINGCAPMEINFMDNSTGATSWNWDFPGGTPSTSILQNPTVVYDQAGSYDVTLDVTNANGADGITKTSHINILDVPASAYTYVVDDSLVTFTNFSTNVFSYSWNFGDGTFSTDLNPEHVYGAAGVYEVVLTAANGCGSHSTTYFVEVINVQGIAPAASFTSNVNSGCEPLEITFTDLSAGEPTGWNWSFPGGTPSTSTEQSPTVVYNNAGSYSVSLEVSNNSGNDIATQISYVSVQSPPTSDFNISQNILTTTFSNTSSNATSYSWDFGDGTSSTEANPTHTYAMGGTYSVTLAATNSCGSVVSSQQVTFATAPVGAFTSNVTTGCGPLTVEFEDTSTGTPNSWNWSFPGGTPNTSTEQNPTVTFANAGSYSVALEVGNSFGTNVTNYVGYVLVQGAPTAEFYASQNGLTATFNNNSVNATSYSWNFGDGNTSTEANPVHTYATSGTYSATLTATNDCGATVSTVQVTFANAPVVAFGSNVTNGCGPLTVEFADLTTGAPNTWNWSFPGGTPSTSTEQNPTVTYETTGTYSVTLVANNSIGSNSNTQTNYIEVLDAPSASFNPSVSILTATFTNTSTNAFSYEWDFGDGNTSTGESPTNIYAEDGTYTVSLTATNACGSITTTQEILVVSLPTIGFVPNMTTGCAPMEVEFTDMSSENVASWSWSFPGATPSTSSAQNPTVVYNTPGTYDVTLVGTNTAGSSSFTQTSLIVVESTPAVSFGTSVSSLDASFSNTSTNALSYAWNFGDGNTSTEMNPTHTYAANGTYVVTLTAINACGSTTTTETVEIQFSGTAPSAAFAANITSGCSPLTVEFSDMSTANADTWAWSFPGGSPATSTEQNPTVEYSATGMYDVILVVSNAGGSNTATQTSLISVGAAPVAGFSSDVNGAIVSLTNSSTGATTYAWDFGDGTTSSQMNPTHTYSADGTYTISMTVTNDCGMETTTETITVVTAATVAFATSAQSGCAPLVVNFTDLSSGTVDSWLWEIDGATPNTSTEQNPDFTFETAGTYNVSLTVTNASGSYTATQSNVVIVNTTPTANFDVNGVGTVYTFNNTSSGATTYTWDFGDGMTSSEANPTHTYAADGTYNIILTATNTCGSVTSTETVQVVSAPLVAFAADVVSGCAPLTVNFSDQTSGTADSWLWTIDGATPNTSTEQNPTMTFDAAGTYDVTLTVTNSLGSFPVTQTSMIVVQNTPTADFEIVQSGSVYSFINNSSNATSYLWDFGDGTTSTEMNPTHTYATDGMFTITLTATNGCGDIITSQEVEIIAAPSVAFTADVLSGCAPLTVNFSDLTTGTADSYAWVINGATQINSTEQNPTATFETAGIYDVTLTVTNANGSYPVTQLSMIVVEDTPTAAFDAAQSGSVYSFTNNSTSATSYQWNFGDGSMLSTEMNPTHVYAMSGTYTVELISTNACGSDTTSVLLAVEAAPMAAFTADTTFGCAPLTINFTDESVNATSWTWTFDGGTPSTSTDQNPIVTYDTPGTYTVGLNAANGVGSDNITLVAYVVIEAAPTAEFFINQDTTSIDFLNTSVGGSNATYTWDFGDGNTSTEIAPTHNYAGNGAYPVVLTVTNDCGTATFESTILINVTNTFEVSFIDEFLVYPNPNDGQFTVILRGQPKDDLHLNLINIIGQYIHKEEVDFSSGQLNKEMNFDQLPVGTYILELKSNREVTYKKLVIE